MPDPSTRPIAFILLWIGCVIVGTGIGWAIWGAWLAAERAVLRRAARRLRRMAVLRFFEHGTDDVRGAAIWDSAAYIEEQR